jgi:F0F1-type ATP synthase membrane subunit c/vacuolar-type H+-ATPase subunit K
MLGFKLLAGALSSCAFIGVAIGVGLVFASLVYSIARNPAQKNELLRYAFIGFSLVEASGMIGLVFGFVLLFGLQISMHSYS